MSKLANINAQLSNEDYHSKREFLSASSVKTLLKNPYEFLHPIKKESINFSIGSAVHCLILEPHKFNDEFAKAPDNINKRTKLGKEQWAEFEADNSDKTILSHEDFELCYEIAQAVLKKDETKALLNNGIAECSFFSEIDGVKVKCRPDYYIESLGIVVDVKTCKDASPDAFIKDVVNFGYHVQAQFYLDVLQSLGKNANKFVFIAVEKKEPYMVGIYELDITSLDFGRNEYKRAFEIYKEIEKYNKAIYKDTTDGAIVQTLTLPNWAFYKRGA